MHAAEQQAGRRLVDVLDLHWYPEAQGGGVRVTDDSAAVAVAAARVQAPRSLWDQAYTETSWITQFSTQGPIALLPRLEAKIAAHAPGTRLSVSEYYYGGGDDISGGIAQADVLGIFGREGVFAATLWKLGGTSQSFIYGGFEVFRNYDGRGGRFGDTAIAAATTDAAASSFYASVDAGAADRMVLVAINKSAAPVTAAVAVTHTRLFGRAEVYELTAAGSAPVRGADLPVTLRNAFLYPMPAMSVTTLVLRP